MNAVVRFPSRLRISKREWIDYVNLAADVVEAEKILESMRIRYLAKRERILSALAEGASIEDEGRII